MGSHYTAKCSGCAYEEKFGDPLRAYSMPDGTSAPVQATFVWCDSCRAIRWGESVPPLEDLEEDLEDTEAKHPLIMQALVEAVRLDRMFRPGKEKTEEERCMNLIDQLRRKVAWRRLRTAPA